MIEKNAKIGHNHAEKSALSWAMDLLSGNSHKFFISHYAHGEKISNFFLYQEWMNAIFLARKQIFAFCRKSSIFMLCKEITSRMILILQCSVAEGLTDHIHPSSAENHAYSTLYCYSLLSFKVAAIQCAIFIDASEKHN